MSLGPREHVGAELLRLRRGTGESGPEVAARLGKGWAQSKISRIENAKVGVSLADLAVLLQFYGAPLEVQAELFSMNAAAEATDGTWVVRAAGAPWRQRQVADIEQRLTRLRHYQAMLVPGLLQSRAYVEAIVQAGGFEFPEALVARRLERQQLLTGPTAPRYEVVLDARALLYRPGGLDVTVDQLDHLMDRAMLPAVQLRIVPLQTGRAALAMTAFMIFDFRRESAPAVVLVETHDVDLYHCAPSDLTAYGTRFARLQQDALDPADSLDYLVQLRRDVCSSVRLDDAEVPVVSL